MRFLKRWYGHLAMLAANIIFGLNMVVSRSLMPDVLHPLALNFFRMGGAAVLFWLASFFVRRNRMQQKDLLLLFLASLFGIVINQIFFVLGLSTTTPVTASIIATLLPVITLVLAFIFMGEPITVMKVAGIIIGASGALILILNNTGAGGSSPKGMLLVFLSGLSYACYLTLFKRLIARYHPVHLMKWMFTFAVLMSLPICYKDFSQTNFASIGQGDWLRIAYVVVFATHIAYLLIPIGQRSIRPTTLSMYSYVQPVTASALAVLWGMDSFGYLNVISALLVFAGVYVVTQSKSRIQMQMEKRRKSIARIRKTKAE